MEDLILTGVGIPLTPWTMVNGDKLVPLLDRIRENLPEEIQHAQRIMEQRELILTDAQQKASQIMQDAKHQAELMLSESELLRAVHAEADRIRQQIVTELEAVRKKAYEEAEAMKAQAYEEARGVRDGADQYAEAILGSLDKSLSEFQGVVRNGQKYLKQARVEAMRNTQQQGPRYSYHTQPGTMPPALQPTDATTPQVKSAEDFLKQSRMGV